jgi:hypothetical protein
MPSLSLVSSMSWMLESPLNSTSSAGNGIAPGNSHNHGNGNINGIGSSGTGSGSGSGSVPSGGAESDLVLYSQGGYGRSSGSGLPTLSPRMSASGSLGSNYSDHFSVDLDRTADRASDRASDRLEGPGLGPGLGRGMDRLGLEPPDSIRRISLSRSASFMQTIPDAPQLTRNHSLYLDSRSYATADAAGAANEVANAARDK